MYFTIRFFISFLLFVLLITSCSEKEKTKTVEESFVSYISNSTTSIIFGKVVLKDFINNLQYNDLPKLNVLLSKEVTTISKGFNLNEPIYFSIDSLLQQDGYPSEICLLMKVKNKDSLADKLSSLGYLIEPGKEKFTVIGKNLSGLITNNLAIIQISKHASKESVNNILTKTFSPLNEDIKTFLDKKSTFSIHIHLENLQKLLDKQSLERSLSKKAELIALYKNSFINADFNLKNENLIGDILFNFNNSLKKRLFFKNNAQQNLSKIVKNDFVCGIGLAIDPLKTDLFINDFYPSLITELTSRNLTIQLALMSLGNKPISNLTGGDIAFAFHNLGNPTFNITLGNKADEIRSISTPYLSMINLPNLHFEGNILSNTVSAKNQVINYNCDKNSGFIFVYDSKNDSKPRPLNDNTKFLDAIASLTITLNNNEGTIVLKGKKQDEGLLHQIVKMYLTEIEALMN
jgi:hypothetical protein